MDLLDGGLKLTRLKICETNPTPILKREVRNKLDIIRLLLNVKLILRQTLFNNKNKFSSIDENLKSKCIFINNLNKFFHQNLKVFSSFKLIFVYNILQYILYMRKLNRIKF